jgi:hypothetical protein
MAKIKRRSGTTFFEEKYGDVIAFLIGPPKDLTPELERDIEDFMTACPEQRNVMGPFLARLRKERGSSVNTRRF